MELTQKQIKNILRNTVANFYAINPEKTRTFIKGNIFGLRKHESNNFYGSNGF